MNDANTDIALYAIQAEIIRAAPIIAEHIRRGYDIELRLNNAGQLVAVKLNKSTIRL